MIIFYYMIFGTLCLASLLLVGSIAESIRNRMYFFTFLFSMLLLWDLCALYNLWGKL